jgi:hypothetical protein
MISPGPVTAWRSESDSDFACVKKLYEALHDNRNYCRSSLSNSLTYQPRHRNLAAVGPLPRYESSAQTRRGSQSKRLSL